MGEPTHADLITRWRLAKAKAEEANRAEAAARRVVIQALNLHDDEMGPIAIRDGSDGFYITERRGTYLIATHTSEMKP